MTETSAQPAAPAAPAPITVASAVAAHEPISRETAVLALRNSRAASNDTGARPDPARTEAQRPNPASDAARTLGKLGQEARAKARQATDTSQPENASQEEGQHVEDEAANAATLDDETADDEQPNEAEHQAETDEGDDTPKIKLGEGVEVSLDEVRDGFMMKADHTRKTQALAQERTQFESDRTQRLKLLDTGLAALSDMIGKPHSLREHLQADPVNGMMNHAIEVENFERLALLNRTRADEQAHHDRQNRANAINALKEVHGDKAETHYNAAVDHASELLGMDKGYLGAMMAHPAIIDLVHKAKAYDTLQANKGNITKQIAGKPKVVRPGAKVSQQGAQRSAVQNAHAKLKSSGNLADAVALLRTMRGKRG